MDRTETLRRRIEIFRNALKRRPNAPEADAYRIQIEKDETGLAEIDARRLGPQSR